MITCNSGILLICNIRRLRISFLTAAAICNSDALAGIMTTVIRSMHWIIIAKHEHIVPKESLAGGGIGICVEEALDDGVIISALEIIEACLLTIVLSLHCFRCLLSIVEEATKGVQKADFPSYRLSLSPFIIRQLKAFLQQYF